MGEQALSVESQAVCEVYEGPDGLVSSVPHESVNKMMTNQPLWIRELALHHSWSRRLKASQDGAPAKLVKTNSVDSHELKSETLELPHESKRLTLSTLH